jgi:hypothetical protein
MNDWTPWDWLWLAIIVLGALALFFGLKEAILPEIQR